jgi:hypothetical protein
MYLWAIPENAIPNLTYNNVLFFHQNLITVNINNCDLFVMLFVMVSLGTEK